MNDLALLAIGAGFGLALALIAVMVYGVWTTASGFRRTVNASLAKVAESLAAQNAVVDKLRAEVSLALSRMDAERLYEASLAVQRSSKAMGSAVATLTKAIYAQPAAPAFDLADPMAGIEDEAEDDARVMAEQSRWAQPDPLAGLSEEEKNRRVHEFFQNRQRDAGINRFGSSPPTAGAGAYASLIEEAQQSAPPTKPPADIHDEPDDAPWELDGKGELGE